MNVISRIINFRKIRIFLLRRKKLIHEIPKYDKGSYLSPSFLRHINKDKIKLIFEIGSRDAIDAIDLHDYYKARVYVFECNPEGIRRCKHNLLQVQKKKISLVDSAVWDKNGVIDFFPIVGTKIKRPNNIGFSSCFELDKELNLIQDKIKVPSIRLDTWMKKEKLHSDIDLICMDVQGASMQVLSGLGIYIKKVKYIILELEYEAFYKDEILYKDVKSFLERNNFIEVEVQSENAYGNMLFIRKELYSEKKTSKLSFLKKLWIRCRYGVS
jgi:FkbM family methyltransferase